MVATHDPRLVAITEDLARRHGRAKDSFEFQMLYGIRPHEQERLAERPQNLSFFLRSLGRNS
jgi:proline dehydrogenase